MGEQELQRVLETIERVRAANSTPEQARRFLVEEGVITEGGELTQPYQRSAPENVAP
jgi:hypothetical protein